MKIYTKIAALILSTFFIGLPYCYASTSYNIQSWVTSNGSRVLFYPIKELPIADIEVAFDAGSSRDGALFGLSQLTAGLLNEGTKTRTAEQIAKAFDDVGAVYDEDVTRDMTVVSLRSLTEKEDLNSALDTFIDVLSKANFPEKSFARVKKLQLRALQQQQQSPSKVASKAFLVHLYGDYPYAHAVLGTQATVEKMKPTECKSFYQQYYAAKNALIVIVGDLQKDDAVKIANQISSAMPRGAQAKPLQAISKVSKADVEKIDFPSTQTHVFLGQLGIKRSSKNYFPLKVANYTLGGDMVSRLFKTVRIERGLAYSVGSYMGAWQQEGPFVIILQSKNGSAEQALNVAKSTLTQYIKTGPTADELKLAKQQLAGSFAVKLASNGAIADALVSIGFYHLSLDYLTNYRQNISAVTLAQASKALKETIHPDALLAVMVGRMT